MSDSKAICIIEVIGEEGRRQAIEFKGKRGDGPAEGEIGELMADIQSLRTQVNQFLTDVIVDKEKKCPPPPEKKKKDEEVNEDGSDDGELMP